MSSMWKRIAVVTVSASMLMLGGAFAQAVDNSQKPEWSIVLDASQNGPAWVKVNVNEKGQLVLSGSGTMTIQSLIVAAAQQMQTTSAVPVAVAVPAVAPVVAPPVTPPVTNAANDEVLKLLNMVEQAAESQSEQSGAAETNETDEALVSCPKPIGLEGGAKQEKLEKEDERGDWRISFGPSLIGSVQSSIGLNHAQMRLLSGFGEQLMAEAAARRGWRHRAEAYGEGSGARNNGVRMFDDGAWFDPIDSGSVNDPDFSWNWRLHDPTEKDLARHGKAFVERTAYDEIHQTASILDGDPLECWSSDASGWFPGLRAELAYELYRSEDKRPWGVDVAVAFAYYFQRGLWKTGGEAGVAQVSGHEEKGYWEWWNDSHDEAQYILDYYRDTQFDGSMWGSGSFFGPGAELAVDSWKVRDVMTSSSSWSSSHSLRYCGYGDYQECSIELLLRPWWEVWQWLRLFGSLGLEISRREFDWNMDIWGTDDTRYRESGTEDEWRVLGLLGGGFAFQWWDFVLAGEALWRIGGDDLDVSGKTLKGGIEHGNWGFRMSLGYEF